MVVAVNLDIDYACMQNPVLQTLSNQGRSPSYIVCGLLATSGSVKGRAFSFNATVKVSPTLSQ